MLLRSLAFTTAFVLATPLLIAEEIDLPEDRTAWISFQRVPSPGGTLPTIHARATENVEAKFFRTISLLLDRLTEASVEVESYGDADLKYGNRDFAVIRHVGWKLTITTGRKFPERAMRTVARQMARSGYETEFVSPEQLLRPNLDKSRYAPPFVVPPLGEKGRYSRPTLASADRIR